MKSWFEPSTFVGYPEHLNRLDYERARQFITQMLRNYEDLVALYEYGTLEAPGLSDLDFIAVLVDEPTCEGLKDIIFLRRAPGYVVKALNGTILRSMSEKHFRKVQLLGAIQAKKLCGKAIAFDTIPPVEQQLIKIADTMDWLPERILMLGVYANMEQLPIRRLIGCLYSLQHSVKRIFEIMGERDERAVEFVKQLHTLRQDWLSRDRATNLSELIFLLHEGISVGIELLTIISEYLLDHGYYTPTTSQSDSYFYIDPGKKFRFKSDKDLAGIYPDSVGVVTLDVPHIWLSHLRQYGAASGIISDLIRNNMRQSGISSQGAVDAALCRMLDARIELCNNMASFLRKIGIYEGLYRFAHLKRI